MILGLTGQTGAGKSTVCALLKGEPGVKVVDADRVARRVISGGSDCLAEIVMHFSIVVLNQDGTLNRKKLAEIVFNDRAKLQELNRITFPHIFAAIQEEICRHQAEGCRMVVLDAPVLFESKADRLCDKVLVVLADEGTRKRRIMERDGLLPREADARMSSQFSDEFYLSRADFVIRNDGDMTALRLQLAEMLDRLKTSD